MKELWVKKTIWRRYLIEDDDVDNVKSAIEHNHFETIEEIFNVNDEIEYDNEKVTIPIKFEIKEI